jgi:hypothetical protein
MEAGRKIIMAERGGGSTPINKRLAFLGVKKAERDAGGEHEGLCEITKKKKIARNHKKSQTITRNHKKSNKRNADFFEKRNLLHEVRLKHMVYNDFFIQKRKQESSGLSVCSHLVLLLRTTLVLK